MELLQQAETRPQNTNIKKIIGRYLKKWPWIVLSVLLFYFAGKMYLRYTTPQYLTKATVKIEGLTPETAMGEFQKMGAPGLSVKTSASEEIPIILSRPVTYEVVKKHNLAVTVRKLGRISDSELYLQAPVEVQIASIKNPETFGGAGFTFNPKNNHEFTLTAGDSQPTTHRYGAYVTKPFGTFVITAKPGSQISGPLEITLRNPIRVAEQLQSSISISENQLNPGILELNHVSVMPERSRDILNSLVQVYNSEDLQNKREQSKVSLDFIDERLAMLTQDLGSIESEKEGFKRQNQITDLEAHAQISLQDANESTKQLMEQSTQLEMVNSVLSALGRSSSDQLLPSNVGLPATINQIIGEYNELVLTKTKTLRQATPSNPAIVEMNKEINALRSLIRDNLRRSQQDLQLNIGKINSQLSTSRSNISKFPTQEKIFRNIDRQQSLKEQLYLYLLQKKEETSIAMAVTMPKVRIINPAYSLGGPVEPKAQQIMMGSVLAGLLLPLLILYVIFAMDTQVKTKNDLLQAVPDLPVMAEVPNVVKDESDIVGRNDLSVYAESFRILTSNLKFMLKKSKGSVVLFTSSVKGEGKTTISVNSALTLASTRKVLLIGADLRNPELSRYIPRMPQGLSNFLAQEDAGNFRQYIFPSGFHDNLDVMDSGSIPPNPTDLLEDEKLASMVEALRSDYDYVIIDSAPMMMVSDTFHVLRVADAIMYVVRANYTEKELLTYIDTVAKDENVKQLGVVLNDVHKNEMRYGYGGKYGYGYHDEKTVPAWKRWLGLS